MNSNPNMDRSGLRSIATWFCRQFAQLSSRLGARYLHVDAYPKLRLCCSCRKSWYDYSQTILIFAVFMLPMIVLATPPLTESERKQAAMVLLERGAEAYSEERWSDAAIYYTASLQHWGSSQAATNLCNLYLYGRGVTKNFELALQLCETAAAMNSSSALVMLGEMYHFGLGVPPDRSKAIEYYRKGAEMGHSQAQFVLGVLLAEDNRPEAIRWLSAAAGQGHGAAAEALAAIEKDELSD